MTINRNIWEDQKKTKERILDRSKHCDDPEYNWLGHKLTSGAAKVDELLLDGAPLEALLAIDMGGGTIYRAYKNHRRHLEKSHGLTVTKGSDGNYMFDSI